MLITVSWISNNTSVQLSMQVYVWLYFFNRKETQLSILLHKKVWLKLLKCWKVLMLTWTLSTKWAFTIQYNTLVLFTTIRQANRTPLDEAVWQHRKSVMHYFVEEVKVDTTNMTKVITWWYTITSFSCSCTLHWYNVVFITVVHKAVDGTTVGGIQKRTKKSW